MRLVEKNMHYNFSQQNLKDVFIETFYPPPTFYIYTFKPLTYVVMYLLNFPVQLNNNCTPTRTFTEQLEI